MSKKKSVTVRLLFVDGGSYHEEDVSIPSGAMERWDRLIDCVREDEEVVRRVHVDGDRLCAAWVVD